MEERIIGKDVSIKTFCECLGSSMPAPGGGGAAALCAALGTCLMQMVGCLTKGKKKYAQYEAEIVDIIADCSALSERFQNLIEEDAEGFLPLAKAYSIAKDDPSRDEAIEQATMLAIKAPIKTIELLGSACNMLNALYEKGSRLALSDVGCAAVLIKSAAEAAVLNVYINTKMLKDREKAEDINANVSMKLCNICSECRTVYELVSNNLKGETRD